MRQPGSTDQESPSSRPPASTASQADTEEETFYPELHSLPGWTLRMRALDGASYAKGGLLVICSGLILEGKRWVHASCSRYDRVPTYEDVKEVKASFIGMDRKAIMVFPEKRFYVNIHPYCLHLFSCLDGDGLPEFSGVVGGLRTL